LTTFKFAFNWIHLEDLALFKYISVNGPCNGCEIRVRNVDVHVEGKRFRSLRNHFGLKVDDSGLDKESWLDTHTLDSSQERWNLTNTCQFKRDCKVSLVINVTWSVLKVEFKRALASSLNIDLYVPILFLIIVIILFILVLIQRILDIIDVEVIDIDCATRALLVSDGHYYLASQVLFVLRLSRH